jgi:hypothetical protein
MVCTRPAVGVVNNNLFVIGGVILIKPGPPYPTYKFFNNTTEYDPLMDEWIVKTPMKYPRTAACGVVNDKIYVIGGGNGSFLNINEEYTPENDLIIENSNQLIFIFLITTIGIPNLFNLCASRSVVMSPSITPILKFFVSSPSVLSSSDVLPAPGELIIFTIRIRFESSRLLTSFALFWFLSRMFFIILISISILLLYF